MRKFLFAVLAALALTVAPVEAAPSLSSDVATDLTGSIECRSPSSFSSPQCSAHAYDTAANLAYPGNGDAQPAVALNTISGYSAIHGSQYVLSLIHI